MALLELDSKKRTSLLNARLSFDEAITALDKAHQELKSLVVADRHAKKSLPELEKLAVKGDESIRSLCQGIMFLERTDTLLEEATDLLIDVKEAAWT
jgi:hypothetical protein